MVKKVHETWVSDPLVNRINNLPSTDPRRNEIRDQMFRLMSAAGGEKSVSFLKKRLGKQDYTCLLSCRFWVWETSNWRVYANNVKGTCFEIREDLTDEEAFLAWADFIKKIDLLSIKFTPEQESFFRSMMSPTTIT